MLIGWAYNIDHGRLMALLRTKHPGRILPRGWRKAHR
jgi:hypothetical protein